MSDRFGHTLERKLERKGDESGDSVADVRRFEVITGTGRRRRWSTDEKARILAESFVAGVNVSEVARRNGLTPQQLFGWRRELREFEESASPSRGASARAPRPASSGLEPGAAMAFAPIVVGSAPSPPSPPSGPTASGIIEIVIGDMIVRVIGPVEHATLAAVLRAVRRSA